MEFVPGTYVFDAFMMNDGLIHLPAETKQICPFGEPLGICIAGTDIEYPEQNLTSWVSGGANVEFTLTENDVYAENTLVFFVAEVPLPTDWDTFETSLSVESYQDSMIAFLSPILR
ncbi:MAG: hypothetical protein ACP5OA_00840, partial [Candidatus Woesearchaeota archaeon]